MTDDRLDEIERVAREAAPMSWRAERLDEEDDVWIVPEALVRETSEGDMLDAANARHIATADPSTVLELVEEVRRLRRDLAKAGLLRRWGHGVYEAPPRGTEE